MDEKVTDQDFVPSETVRFSDLLGRAVAVEVGVAEPSDSFQTYRCFISSEADGSNVDRMPGTDNAILLCNELEAKYQPVVLTLAAALQIAEDALLELGSSIVVCGDCAFSRLVGEVSKWWAQDRVLLTQSESRDSDRTIFTEILDVNGGDTQSKLGSAIGKAKTLSCVDFSGLPAAWSLILTEAPNWSRFVGCSPNDSTMTIDFYNDVHRKGATIVGHALDARQIFHDGCSLLTPENIVASTRILSDTAVLDRMIDVLEVRFE